MKHFSKNGNYPNSEATKSCSWKGDHRTSRRFPAEPDRNGRRHLLLLLFGHLYRMSWTSPIRPSTGHQVHSVNAKTTPGLRLQSRHSEPVRDTRLYHSISRVVLMINRGAKGSNNKPRVTATGRKRTFGSLNPWNSVRSLSGGLSRGSGSDLSDGCTSPSDCQSFAAAFSVSSGFFCSWVVLF